eukprot:7000977-Pyramimonas_sp.AAC.1
MIDDLRLTMIRMPLCHFGLECNRADAKLSGACLQSVTTCSRIPTTMWRCKCVDPIQRVLDWCGH